MAAGTCADRPVEDAEVDNITKDSLEVGVKGGKDLSEGT